MYEQLGWFQEATTVLVETEGINTLDLFGGPNC